MIFMKLRGKTNNFLSFLLVMTTNLINIYNNINLIFLLCYDLLKLSNSYLRGQNYET